MARGGTRPGSGRPKGAKNVATEEAIAKAKETGELPLDFLLRIMRDDAADEAKRIDCAKAAAPYVHAKLTSVEGTIKADLSIHTVAHKIIDGNARN